jgi:hypothetical protein
MHTFCVVSVVLAVAFVAPCGAADQAADNGFTVSTSPPEGTVGAVASTEATPWVALPPAPVAVSRPAGAVADGKFFVIGGEESGGLRSGYVQEYNPVTNAWTNTRLQMPTGASNLCAAAINGKIYVPGGYTGSALADLQIYDVGLDMWTVDVTDPLPAARFASACTEYDGKLYVFGGNDGAFTTTTTYIYDPLAPDGTRWTPGASAPFSGQYGAAIGAGGYVYYAGLYEAGDTADVMRYHPVLDAWSLLPSLTTARGGAQMWLFEGNLVVGGGGWSTYLTSTEMYDLSTGIGGSWSPGNSLVTGRRTFAGAQDDVNSLIYAGPGWGGSFLDAADLSTFFEGDPIFADGFETGNTSQW